MKMKRKVTFESVSHILFMMVMVWLEVSNPVFAHHVLGRPSYSLSEDSTTPPSMQVETQIGAFYVTYMVFPAFPQPNQPGRVNLYASRIDNGAPFTGEVQFSVRDDAWFSSHHEILGVQANDDGVHRQGFVFKEHGGFIITAEFAYAGEPYIIDFPLRIGEPSTLGPLGVSVAAIFVTLIGVSLVKRNQVLRGKIRTAHQAGHP